MILVAGFLLILCYNVIRKLGSEYFASISSSSGQQTASVGVNPQSVSPPPSGPSQIGSPLFWVGVGVALSAIFSWVATRLKVSSYLLQGTNVCILLNFLVILLNNYAIE
ncbi:PROTEIN TIC 40 CHLOROPLASTIC [Salix viminalis]|uniref:PROTEIN TIC 40 CHLOROPLASTIC n=1 Tax=Salix viminalis TaxID=40686 RepID=A0A9Q0P9S5_SALVM|nr:PROTEIN TIC 40 CHLOROPLASTIC [Salix viminalis]